MKLVTVPTSEVVVHLQPSGDGQLALQVGENQQVRTLGVISHEGYFSDKGFVLILTEDGHKALKVKAPKEEHIEP